MYKRPARLLFTAPEAVAAIAVACVGRVAAGWAEARATAAPDPGQLAWADLFVILDLPDTPRLLPELPGPDRSTPPRTVRWQLPAGEGAARAELDRRVQALVGGMKMLARMDR